MAGHFLDRFLASRGYRLLRLDLLEEERRARARAEEALARLQQTREAELSWFSAKLESAREALRRTRAAEREARDHTARQAQAFAAEKQAHAQDLARLWARVEGERARQRALQQAEAEARAAAGAAAGEVERLGQLTAWLSRRLERQTARLEAARSEAASLQHRLGHQGDPADSARLYAKLASMRDSAERLKAKLRSEQKRAARLAAQLDAAQADLRAARLDARRAVSDAGRRRAEVTLAAETSRSGRAGTSGRRSEADAAHFFQLGRAFQAQGSIDLAAAAYRKAGPALKDLLRQEGPDGDQITGPNFIIVGAARSGTTWLKKCLAYHPQVFMLSGEQHYFSASSHFPPEIYVQRFASPHTRFQRPGTKTKQFARPSGRLYGEKSATYLAMPDAQIDLCAALFPEVRLICLVRDPVERVWSHLKHLGAHGSLRIDELGDLPAWNQFDELIRQSRYEEHLVRWAWRFDPEQILLVDFTRIAGDPEAVRREVLNHIGAEPGISAVDLEQVGGTEPMDMPRDLASRLRQAFEGERFDIPYLREAMARAAETQREGRSPAKAARRSGAA